MTDRSAGTSAAVACFRDSDLTEMTFWRDRAEAEEVLRTAACCGPACVNRHALVVKEAGRIRTVTVPALPFLLAPVVPGSWRIDSSRRLVHCSFCGGQHSHSNRHVGTVRASGCLRGFYRIIREANDHDE